MIERTSYLKELLQWKEKSVIKVLTGIRRCGKSSLLKMFADYLMQNGAEKDQIIFLNLEDLANKSLLTAESLYEYILPKLCKNKFTYIFIDEIQQCKEFERAVDSLFIQKNIDLYITGSNAYFLSGELATLLSGRYVTIRVLPLSFKEFILFNGKNAVSLSLSEKRDFFTQFMIQGQFPYIPFLNNDSNTIQSYVEGIYNTIILKDVAQREKIVDVALLERIVSCLCSAIGSPVSIKKITDTIISSGRKISVNTVDNYIHALVMSFIFYEVPRFDIKGRNELKTLSKYYLADTGFRSLVAKAKNADTGHILENIVYLELLRRNRKVYIGKNDSFEVDFVTENTDGFSYYQVSATVLDARELLPLQKIKDNYPKYLLTLDDVLASADFNGIKQLNIIDWLLTDS